MKYKRGEVSVRDQTPISCHRRCIESYSNRLDGQAREEATRELAGLMIKSFLGVENEKEMTVDVAVTMACDGPSSAELCNVKFLMDRDYR
jgi:hypothetical protein